MLMAGCDDFQITGNNPNEPNPKRMHFEKSEVKSIQYKELDPRVSCILS